MDDEIEIRKLEERVAKLEKCLAADKEVMNLEEAALFMNVSKSLLYKLTSRKEIPHYKPNGRVVYFERMELLNWLRQNPVKTEQQLDAEAAMRTMQPHRRW